MELVKFDFVAYPWMISFVCLVLNVTCQLVFRFIFAKFCLVTVLYLKCRECLNLWLCRDLCCRRATIIRTCSCVICAYLSQDVWCFHFCFLMNCSFVFSALVLCWKIV